MQLDGFLPQGVAGRGRQCTRATARRSAIEGGIQHLGKQYQGRFAQRFTDAMSNPAAAADEDVCWAGTTLLHGITLMGPSDREILSRWGLAGD